MPCISRVLGVVEPGLYAGNAKEAAQGASAAYTSGIDTPRTSLPLPRLRTWRRIYNVDLVRPIGSFESAFAYVLSRDVAMIAEEGVYSKRVG